MKWFNPSVAHLFMLQACVYPDIPLENIFINATVKYYNRNERHYIPWYSMFLMLRLPEHAESLRGEQQ